MDYVAIDIDTGPVYSLEALQSIDDNSRLINTPSSAIDPIRRETLLTAALEVGAQGGLQARSQQINRFLDNNAELLDMRFQFQPLLINGEILPPVILTSSSAVRHSDDGKTLRIADATYKILKDATFVSAAPTWRNYLYLPAQSIVLPHVSVVPDTKEEKAFWAEQVRRGWEAGVKQANEIHDLAVNELEQDYIGMVNFRKLLAEGKVKSPQITRESLGVTGNSREMAVGDRVRQITKDAGFELNSYDWQAPVLPDDKPAVRSDSRPIEVIQQEVEREDRAAVKGSQGLNGFINQWVAAWESGNVDNYLSFYGRDFMVPPGVSRASWEKSRRASIGRTNIIKVDIEDLNIVFSEDKRSASATFVQKYHFDQYRGKVNKIVLFEMDGADNWTITYEVEDGPRRSSK